jgi:hypothetical protein
MVSGPTTLFEASVFYGGRKADPLSPNKPMDGGAAAVKNVFFSRS